jgi:hypothetical protein
LEILPARIANRSRSMARVFWQPSQMRCVRLIGRRWGEDRTEGAPGKSADFGMRDPVRQQVPTPSRATRTDFQLPFQPSSPMPCASGGVRRNPTSAFPPCPIPIPPSKASSHASP